MFRLFIWTRIHQNLVRTIIVFISLTLIPLALQLAGDLQFFPPTNILPVLTGLLLSFLLLQWGIGYWLLTSKSRQKQIKFSLPNLYWLKTRMLAKGLATFAGLVLCFYTLLPYYVPSANTVQGSKASTNEVTWQFYQGNHLGKFSRHKEDPELKKALKPIRLRLFLLVFGSLLLLAGIAVLACALACNGQEAAAVILVVLGLAGCIFLLAHFGKKLNNKRKSIMAMSPEELKKYNLEQERLKNGSAN